MANKTLYVGNLPYSVSESQLTSHFASYGATNARIVEGRGFGFVDVDSAQMSLAITERHQTDMGGRTLTVNEARPREENSGGGSYSNNRSGNSSSRRW